MTHFVIQGGCPLTGEVVASGNKNAVLPMLATRAGARLQIDAGLRSHERRFGASHYGLWDRAAVGVLDLFGVWWLMRRRRRVQSPKEIRSDGQ